MSVFSRLFGIRENPEKETQPKSYNPESFAVVDTEVGVSDHRIHDIGAVRYDDAIFHKADKTALLTFLEGVDFVCGHNIIHHDAKYLFGEQSIRWTLVDTLYIKHALYRKQYR